MDETTQVHIRIMGSPKDVKLVAAEIRRVLDIIDETKDYRNTVPNRVSDPGIRRYLIVKVPEPVKWVKGMRRI